MANRQILEAIISLQDRGQPPDLILLAEELQARGHLEGVGGPAYLSELLDRTPSAANVAYYARIVREKSITRGIEGAGRRIIHKANNLNGDGIEALLAFAQREITTATSAGAGSSSMEILDMMKQVFREIEAQRERGDTIPGLPTGFTTLDALTGGLKSGLLSTLSPAGPEPEKTALALNIARTWPVPWFRFLLLARNALERAILSAPVCGIEN
jgi:replicative DNA helicase